MNLKPGYFPVPTVNHTCVSGLGDCRECGRVNTAICVVENWLAAESVSEDDERTILLVYEVLRLQKELKRYREREPTVQRLIETWFSGVGLTVETLRKLSDGFRALRDCWCTGASTDMASEANAAGASGAEPTK